MKTSVIIVTYNSLPIVEDALESIPEGVPTIVVDNASMDGTTEFISHKFPSVHLIQSGANLGFAKAVNLGMRHVSTDFVLMLNPDAVLLPGALERLDTEMSRSPQIGILSPTVVEGNGELTTAAAGYEPNIWRMFTHASGASRLAGRFIGLRGHYLLRNQMSETDPTRVLWVSGGCLMTRLAIWRELGGLTERWFMYAEDVDYCLRVGDAGWDVEILPGAKATHQVGASSAHVDHVRTDWLVNLFDLYKIRYRAGKARQWLWLSVVVAGYGTRWAIFYLRGSRAQGARFKAYALAATRLFRHHDVKLLNATGGATLTAARYYPVARTAHLERLKFSYPAVLFYTRTRQDWNLEAAPSEAVIKKVSFATLCRQILSNKFKVLEVPEPLALTLLPRLTFLTLLIKTRNLLWKSSDTTMVFYAIENFDQVSKLRSRIKLPRRLLRVAINIPLRFVLSEVSRIAFGTQGAHDLYRAQLGTHPWSLLSRRAAIREFPALSNASPDPSHKHNLQVCFLGSFEERKGILKLITAWPAVKEMIPDATLVLMGHGPLEEIVDGFAQTRDEVSVIKDPSRSVIQKTLSRAHVLALLSQPTPVWREQIGLPILEGLAEGCEIVSTDETGIASWLSDHGHHVVEHAATSEKIASTLVDALLANRPSEEIKRSLPPEDGRIQADRWLFGELSSAHVTELPHE